MVPIFNNCNGVSSTISKNMLTCDVLKNMCVEYHLINTKIYNKDLYQKELIYRLSYSTICGFIPKDAVYNSTWLYCHNQDEGHHTFILKIARDLHFNNDTNIVGFAIDINLALVKYEKKINNIKSKIDNIIFELHNKLVYENKITYDYLYLQNYHNDELYKKIDDHDCVKILQEKQNNSFCFLLETLRDQNRIENDPFNKHDDLCQAL